MPSHNNAKRIVRLGLLISLAMALSYFERFIPLPYGIPGMKLGLANIVIVTCLIHIEKKDVLIVVVCRVFLTAFVVGNMMSFFYSLTGGLLSYFGMVFVHHYFKEQVSVLGISILGSVLHNVGQLLVLAVVTGRRTIALYYSPMLMSVGVLTGVFVGVASMYFARHMKVIIKSGYLDPKIKGD